MSKEDAETQRWTFGGVRIFASKERRLEWVLPDGEDTAWYGYKSVHYVIGGEYDVLVDSGKTTYGAPTYVEPSDNAELRASLSAQDRAARQYWDRKSRERRAKADDPLEKAICQPGRAGQPPAGAPTARPDQLHHVQAGAGLVMERITASDLEPGTRVQVTHIGTVLDDKGSIEYDHDGTISVIGEATQGQE